MNTTSLPLSSLEKRRFLEILERFNEARILVIGDFILDQFVWGSVKRISPEAPVPVVKVERESFMPGGIAECGQQYPLSSGASLSLRGGGPRSLWAYAAQGDAQAGD